YCALGTDSTTLGMMKTAPSTSSDALLSDPKRTPSTGIHDRPGMPSVCRRSLWVRMPESTSDWPSLRNTSVERRAVLRPGSGVDDDAGGVRSATSAVTRTSMLRVAGSKRGSTLTPVPNSIFWIDAENPLVTWKFCSPPFAKWASLPLVVMTVACLITLTQPRCDARSRPGSGWLTTLAVAVENDLEMKSK